MSKLSHQPKVSGGPRGGPSPTNGAKLCEIEKARTHIWRKDLESLLASSMGLSVNLFESKILISSVLDLSDVNEMIEEELREFSYVIDEVLEFRKAKKESNPYVLSDIKEVREAVRELGSEVKNLIDLELEETLIFLLQTLSQFCLEATGFSIDDNLKLFILVDTLRIENILIGKIELLEQDEQGSDHEIVIDWFESCRYFRNQQKKYKKKYEETKSINFHYNREERFNIDKAILEVLRNSKLDNIIKSEIFKTRVLELEKNWNLEFDEEKKIGSIPSDFEKIPHGSYDSVMGLENELIKKKKFLEDSKRPSWAVWSLNSNEGKSNEIAFNWNKISNGTLELERKTDEWRISETFKRERTGEIIDSKSSNSERTGEIIKNKDSSSKKLPPGEIEDDSFFTNKTVFDLMTTQEDSFSRTEINDVDQEVHSEWDNMGNYLGKRDLKVILEEEVKRNPQEIEYKSIDFAKEIQIQEDLKDTILTDVPGDGLCGLHAIQRSVSELGIDLEMKKLIESAQSKDSQRDWFNVATLMEILDENSINYVIDIYKDSLRTNPIRKVNNPDKNKTVYLKANGIHYNYYSQFFKIRKIEEIKLPIAKPTIYIDSSSYSSELEDMIPSLDDIEKDSPEIPVLILQENLAKTREELRQEIEMSEITGNFVWNERKRHYEGFKLIKGRETKVLKSQEDFYKEMLTKNSSESRKDSRDHSKVEEQKEKEMNKTKKEGIKSSELVNQLEKEVITVSVIKDEEIKTLLSSYPQISVLQIKNSTIKILVKNTFARREFVISKKDVLNRDYLLSLRP